MSNIKRHLLEVEQEEQELWESYLDWCEENRELFSQLGTPTPEEVIGYED